MRWTGKYDKPDAAARSLGVVSHRDLKKGADEHVYDSAIAPAISGLYFDP